MQTKLKCMKTHQHNLFFMVFNVFFLPFLEGTCQGRRCKPPKLILPRLDEVNYSSGSVMSFFFLLI